MKGNDYGRGNWSQAGWKQNAIAAALGVTKGAVSQWMKRAREGRRDALLRRKAPGAASKLSQQQLVQLPAVLARGAEAYGFRGKVWTHARITKVIQQEMTVRYRPHHIARLLKEICWSRQKPRHRASQRNEANIRHWYSVELPNLLRKASPSYYQRIRLLESALYRRRASRMAGRLPRRC